MALSGYAKDYYTQLWRMWFAITAMMQCAESSGFGPYFFVCNYHGRLNPLPQEEGKLSLSVKLEGNPRTYVPEKTYTVIITSSKDFNGLLITGLFSSSIVKSKLDTSSFGMTSIGFSQDSPMESDFVCGVLYSDISPQRTPKSQVTFSWTAPPVGTGCVSFLLTASLGMQIVFQDVVSYKICEEGQPDEPLRPSLADIHSDGVILRDDFDSDDGLDVWSQESEGVTFDTTCGEISHGNAAVFCSESIMRQLVTPSLNLTSAMALQFTIGSGTCQRVSTGIDVSYRQEGSTTWTAIRKISVGRTRQVHVIQVPEAAQRPNVQLKLAQELSEDSYTGCWAVDNILVTRRQPYPTSLHENMDPINIGNWLFMPGANIKGGCMSQGHAMIFSSSSDDPGPTYAVTHDLDLSGELEAADISDAVIKGGTLHSGACGHGEGSQTYKFSGGDVRSYCTTAVDSLVGKFAVSFVLSIGSGDCNGSDSHDKDIEFYGLVDNDKELIANFTYDAHKKPGQVTVRIPASVQVDGAVICLEQKSNGGEGLNEWAVDSFSLIENPTEFHYMMQFTINMGCASIYTQSSVNVEYSTDYGRSWHMLQEECLPETCQGVHWPYHSSYKSNINEGWFRVMLPLPMAALGEHTRFRWILAESGEGEISWAIDDIYVGSALHCPNWCNGHGICISSGCRCDAGYSGPSCNTTTHVLPTFLAIDFNYGSNLATSFELAYGSELGYACGLLGTGKAMVFNGSGKRKLITKPVNATELKFLQFSILMGRHSTTGTCQPPSKPGDGILVHYTTNQGVFWHLLEHIPFDSAREIRVVSIPLPADAVTQGLQIRWSQPNEQLQGKAVWALDDVSLAKDLYKSIYSDAKNFYRIYSTSVSFHTGELTNFCNRTNVLLFSPTHQPLNEERRYAETQSMEVSAGYVLEADVTLNCDHDVNSGTAFGAEDINHEVALQYSRDHGVTWNLVQEENLPGSTSDDHYHAASVYHNSEFQKWTKVTVSLPTKTWSSHLRLRVIQSHLATSLWALDKVYMGPACEMNCHNRGRCRNGQCMCDANGIGQSCLPKDGLPHGVDDQFDDMNRLKMTGWFIVGAEIANSSVDKSGCGPMPSAHYLHFTKAGVRKVVTPDLDTSYGGQIQFYIRIGGGNCRVPTDRANGVLLQFSNDGGITWELLDELYYSDYQVPTYVHRDIPPQAMTRQTRFQFWQPRNTGANHDQWSVSEVIVGEPMLSDHAMAATETLKISSRRSAHNFRRAMVKTFILLSNEGQPEDFCESSPDSYVFNKAKGDRFATTDDFKLKEGDTIQFELNIGCSQNFSWNSPIRLEFSHDGGYSWDLVIRACYLSGRPKSQMLLQHAYDDTTAHDCTGAARELKEGSIYYEGDFKEWKRVIVSVSSRVAAMPVRFRWSQKVPLGMIPTSWSIRSVYIGQSCQSFCSGHGTCTLGMNGVQSCQCDAGRGGDRCEHADEPTTGFWDHVETPSVQEKWWQNVLGISEERGCGENHKGASLYFGGDGTRIAQTVSLDTTGVRLMQFYFRLGSSDDTHGCSTPRHRDEAVLVQYSNDNGITWHLIKELNFESYSSRSERVTLDIPFAAKTPSTTFRWWQALRDAGEHRSQWLIYSVFIGVPNLREQGFEDDFENDISVAIWYKVQSGKVGTYSLCNGSTSHTSNSLIVSSDDGVAETWDFRLSSGSFLQFDLAMGCEGENPANDVLNVEYSTDLGISWQPVLPVCVPGSSVGCEHGFGSSFYSELNQDWTRHTLALPGALTSVSKIRFRWIQYYYGEGTTTWAVDNIYLGNGCPWMCGGHGRCWPYEDRFEDHCICDSGFKKVPHCEPSVALPSMVLDTFDHPWIFNDTYSVVIGREPVRTNDLTSVGLMVSGENLQMGKAGIRILQTMTLDTTDAKYIQFYICYKGAGRNPPSTIVLQCSNNNGIKWSTIHLLSAGRTELDEKSFVHVILPRHCRLPAVSFRLWQANIGAATPVFEKSDEVWALENLVIGGHSSGCDKHFLWDDFSDESNSLHSNWLFHSGGQISNFCNSQAAMSFKDKAGEHSVSTTDLCISENYVIQFKIAVGCSTLSAATHAVRLEFSTDHGITWSLVRPHCHGDEVDPSGCTDELHPASIYHPGAATGWQRIIIPLDRHHICSSVRFRWYQGFYSDDFESASAVHWGLDEVYIGPGCDEMCNGHGICSEEGEKCVCDPGFGGKTCCDVTGKNPTFLQETFDHQEDKNSLIETGKWTKLAGGDIAFISSECKSSDDTMKQWVFRSDKQGERFMETNDLDMRDAVFIQFYMRLNHQTESTTTEPVQLNGGNRYSEDIGDLQPVSESLYLQFSTDGGITWSLLEEFPFISANLDQSQYIALHLPEAARANATRFSWWQPTRDGKSMFGFILDQIVIGGNQQVIDDDFSSIKPSNWLEISGGLIQPNVGSSCCSLEQGKNGACHILELGHHNNSVRDCDSNFALTNSAKVGPGSFISFNLKINCEEKSDSCEAIELQYSSDLGHTWLPLILPCYPNNPECTRYHTGSTFLSDVYSASSRDEQSRIILPLPEHSWSPATRFRWLQRRNVHSESWLIDNVYVGDECPGACSGRGRCHNAECICDGGWTGHFCEIPTKDLPFELKEVFTWEFSENPDSVGGSLFTRQIGGQIDRMCGEVGYDQALHFFQPCTRLLETVALNTTEADFVQFMFRTGCGASPMTERNQGVMVDYTTNGGAVWHNLAELYYEDYNSKPGFVNILLPSQAKAIGVQFRWSQFEHAGLNYNDWAIDNLLIGGKREEQMLSDDFSVVKEVGPAGLWFDRGESDMWEFYDNTEPDSFCGRDDVILAGTVPGLDATISTKDFLPEEGFIMQYTIVVLCQDVQMPHQPVHVQFSTDFGDTWQYLVGQCIPSDKDCFGKEVTQPSAHFITPDWRRRTIWIPSSLYRQPVRFRFHQEGSDVLWALDRLFIGPACVDACSGHGDCTGVPQDDMFRMGEVNYDDRRCHCDFGYEAPNCYLGAEHEQKYLKDDFNGGMKMEGWSIAEAEKIDIRCGLIVDGSSLSFDGVGPRQAETVDLDLRDAKFVKHNIVIGGLDDSCLPAKRREDGILLQYSSDGGISWKMMHSMDYNSYSKPKSEYILLPLDAKTNATRIRWWQPFTFIEKTGLVGMGEDRAGWAVDNVYVGGHEVNTPSMADDFEVEYDILGNPGALDEELYDFYPNGLVAMGQCPGDDSSHMAWPAGDSHSTTQSLTTRELIVTPGHMIQFRIKIGCGEQACSQDFPVKLEYREDPRYDDWILVKPECYPATPPSPRCPPYVHHDPSVYTLDRDHDWKRITIPLDGISSGTTQFRWSQEGGAPDLFSWAVDDIYIGESCPSYCSGHGKCTKTLQCICDEGFTGDDCGEPVHRYLVPVFRDNFEREAVNTKRWLQLTGGIVSSGGCGPLRPFGFSRSVYFGGCGKRELLTREMDLVRSWQVQYVIQVGSSNPTKECHVTEGGLYNRTPMSVVLLQYTTNNGITWHTLREHSSAHYGVPRRVSQALPSLARSLRTILRWVQPTHGGKGEDQWAVDNVDIAMSRRQRHLHLIDYRALLRRRQTMPDTPLEMELSVLNVIPQSPVAVANEEIEMPPVVSVREKLPPVDIEDLP